MNPRIVPRTPASSGVDQPSSSRCSESAPVISVVMALSPSAAANCRFGFQFKPEITPPPIPTNPGTAPPRNSRTLAPRLSVPNPRPYLLNAVLAFVRAARSTPGVLRIALLGSLATEKPVPKDADVLVTIDAAMDLDPLARLGRHLQGTAQTVNLGVDIFLANPAGRCLGRICH